MPEISVGQPEAEAVLGYLQEMQQGILIYYPANLKVKQGYAHIRISLKKILFWQWLELHGAQGISIVNQAGDGE